MARADQRTFSHYSILKHRRAVRWRLSHDRYAPMDWIENLADYRDFYSYVFLCAPDDFPEEDFLSDEEQMNLEKAFELLISAP